MDFNIKKVYEYVKTILNKSDEELAKIFNISRITLSRWLSGKSIPIQKNLKSFYDAIYSYNIRLNDIKQEIYKSNETKKINNNLNDVDLFKSIYFNNPKY